MNWSSAALAFILLASFIATLFAGGRVVNVVLNTYVFELQDCRYDYPIRPISDDTTVPQEPDSSQECTIDYNAANRDIVGGVSMLVFSVPAMLFTGRLLFFKRKGSS